MAKKSSWVCWGEEGDADFIFEINMVVWPFDGARSLLSRYALKNLATKLEALDPKTPGKSGGSRGRGR